MSEPASEVDRFEAGREYIALQETIPLEHYTDQFETSLRRFQKIRPIGPGTRILEVGVGSGWYLIHAAQQGLSAKGVEVNPELAAYAQERARRAGVEIELEVRSIEEVELPRDAYDIVVAESVLEHVRDYEGALRKIHAALRPGGVLHFNSTNKFALRSGEYPDIRLYGWLPYPVRERIRVHKQGPGIVVSSGIDFNQFTYPGLRRTLKRVGFQRVIDIFDFLDQEDLNHGSRQRAIAMQMYKRIPGVKPLLTTFANGTDFYCVK